MGRTASLRIFVASACLAVALWGCASEADRPTPPGGTQGLFRAPAPMSGDIAPSPNAGWYVPTQAPRYVKMGLAGRHDAERGGFGRWLAGAFGRKAGDTPAAVIADTAALPLPSVVRLENVRTGSAVTLRIEERAPLDGKLVSLNPAAAQALGIEGEAPTLVRVRYVEPVLAYRQRPSLSYAALRRPRPETLLASAEQKASPVARTEAPVATAVRAPEPAAAPASSPVRLAAAEPPKAVAKVPPAAEPAPDAPAAMTMAPMELRVQAGAFSKPENARRAVAMLAPAGAAAVEPVTRGGSTLYRVFLRAPAERAAAEALRDHVVRIGFADAQIVSGL